MTPLLGLGTIAIAICLIGVGTSYIVGLPSLPTRARRAVFVVVLATLIMMAIGATLPAGGWGRWWRHVDMAVQSLLAGPTTMALGGVALLGHGTVFVWWLTRRWRSELQRQDEAAREAARRRSRGRLPPSLDGGEA